jgi:nitrate reductase cytochrome c-type subunit
MEIYKMKKLLAALIAAVFALSAAAPIAFAEDKPAAEVKKGKKKKTKKEAKKEMKKEMKKEEAAPAPAATPAAPAGEKK